MQVFKLLVVLIVLFTVACGKSKTKAKSLPQPASKRALLEDKFNLYLDLSKSVQDKDGFIYTDVCDSLIFTGLYGVALPDDSINITAARDDLGAWHRRPLDYPECNGAGSTSTISRDMLLGLLWYTWEHQRLDIAQSLWDYGVLHNWVMGSGDVSKIYFTPALQATLAEIIYRLGGTNHTITRDISQLYSKNTGFAAHLDVLLILLRAEMLGFVNTSELSILTYNYNRVPNNPLFSYGYHRYVDGDQTETLNALLNEQYFPNNRLPTNLDRDTEWINQEDPSNWTPAPAGTPTRVFSGGDFLFVAKLVLRS